MNLWISKRLGLYLKGWKITSQAPKGPFFGYTRWSNAAMKGTSFYQRPSWTLNLWFGRRMFCLSRNAA